MSIVRQDAWTNDEDLVLAEVVLRHIREGSTQLAAFDEVGERLSRTSAACGFRWNSSIRKKYEAAIAIAKKQRKSLKKTKLDDIDKGAPVEIASELTGEIKPKLEIVKASNSHALTIDHVIEFLTSQKEMLSSNNNILSKNNELTETVEQLTKENNRLVKELSTLQNNYDVMKQDYRMLIDIMDRAKQMSVAKN
ncbi:RsfA family transcriptional regulator [Anaerobacillus isosaccharinicus]|uniref:RsfA family transcriptional regulator n=1 Tax=Anaerobacillus isosaccharinicus TaxID=1532552 RepID=A0A1S2M798_9BACI|nr:RsfA family transcriptional regulator [Anaerobacillus isosaccharinicus]MBA5587452.1 RsfA family transcriptional regulator [Anaerobacillus isosaccharinicus]QOY34363.1 RsfA family transcriptional regulator [Anaerobacillus isosaccharinicus]